MRFLKDSIQTGITNAIIMVTSFIVGVINARMLGPDGVGIMALLLLLLTLSFSVTNMGLGMALRYYIAKKRISKENALAHVIVYSILSSGLIIILVWFFWDSRYSIWSSIEFRYIKTYLVVIVFYVFINFYYSILDGLLQIRKVNISYLVINFSKLIGVIVFVLLMKLGVMGAIYSVLLSHVLGFAFLLTTISFKRLKKEIVNIRSESSEKNTLFKDMINFGKWSYFNIMITTAFNKGSMVILKFFTNVSVIGLYSKASGLQSMTNLIVDPFQRILFSYTAASESLTAINRTNTLLRVFSLVLTIIAVLGFIFIKWIILILYGEPFMGSVPIFYALSPAVIFIPLYKIVGAHISGVGYIRQKFNISLVLLPLNILITYFLVKYLHGIGAGLSVSVTYFMLFIATLFFYLKKEKVMFAEAILIKRKDINQMKAGMKRIKMPGK